jgi:hypothetical protein
LFVSFTLFEFPGTSNSSLLQSWNLFKTGLVEKWMIYCPLLKKLGLQIVFLI